MAVSCLPRPRHVVSSVFSSFSHLGLFVILACTGASIPRGTYSIIIHSTYMFYFDFDSNLLLFYMCRSRLRAIVLYCCASFLDQIAPQK